MAKLSRNIAFEVALDYLYKEGIVADQQELSEKTGLSESTISRILNDKVKKPSEETIRRLNAAFGNRFNPAYFRCASTYLLNDDMVEDRKENSEKKVRDEDQQSSIIELYAQLIKEVETIRRDLSFELAALRSERQKMADITNQLHHIIGARYTIEEHRPMMAAEPKTTEP